MTPSFNHVTAALGRGCGGGGKGEGFAAGWSRGGNVDGEVLAALAVQGEDFTTAGVSAVHERDLPRH